MNFNNLNPYTIFDGKWGGLGIQRWFRGLNNLPTKNVYERNDAAWVRCWDNTMNSWRDITEDEFKNLPIINQPERKTFNFDKPIFFPIIVK